MNKKFENVLYIIMCLGTFGAFYWIRMLITKAIIVAEEQKKE